MNVSGSCLCGAVSYSASSVKKPSACHCGQCRKQSGHVWASAQAPVENIKISGEVRWFEASNTAKRGFCPICGSYLFWKAHDEDILSFSLGSVDGPTGTVLAKHIFTGDKGDYYKIADGVPQF